MQAKNVQEKSIRAGAKDRGGVIRKRLLTLPIEQIVPDNMHAMMNITKKLMDLLAAGATHNDDIGGRWEKFLTEKCQLKLIDTIDPKTKRKRTFSEKWNAASPTRSQYLAILRNRKLLLEPLDDLLRDDEKRAQDIREVWNQFSNLMALLTQADTHISEVKWRERALKWGRLLTQVYSSSHVTPYIHLFVYHVGYYQERYCGTEKFAQYALEGKHSTNKTILTRGSNKFLHGESEAVKQQLETQLRLEVHAKHDRERTANLGAPSRNDPPASRKERRRSHPAWSAQTLEECGDLLEYVGSATHTS